MASCFSEDLTCSICLAVYTDPVMLLCGHSFCRECIVEFLNKQKHCPICRSTVDPAQSLLTSHVLKSLVEKTKLTLEHRRDKEKTDLLCPEHEEKLKLYCITDRQLICVICRDAQKHESHKFKPVSEASALVRAELQSLFKKISADTRALETLVQSQKDKVDFTKLQSGELKSLISRKFEELYEFLQKREQELTDKVKSDEEAGLNKMSRRLCELEAAIAENKNLEASVTSALQIQDHERFLKTWSDKKEAKAVVSFKPKRGNFKVEKTELTLGPYESHLQMFVWKEMLQVVKPREERLLLKNNQTSLIVSQDQHCATFCSYKDQLEEYRGREQNQYYSNNYPVYHTQTQTQLPSSTESAGTYSGQHYWDVYLGQLSDWELGIAKNYLKNTYGTYQMCTSSGTKSLAVQGKPRKIGIYLNCSKKELSFYNAENMEHIHTASLASVNFPVSAHFKLGNSSHDPLMVCRY